MPDKDSNRTRNRRVIESEVDRLLRATPSFHQLDRPTQQAMHESMTKIASYLALGAEPNGGPSWATQMAPFDLRQQLARHDDTAAPAATPPGPQAPGQPAPADGGAGASGSSGGPTGRVGEVARATLNAIDFPQFVSGLIQGVFQAIHVAHQQQLESYATLLKNVAMTVKDFMEDNVTPDAARDHLADRYGGLINRDTSDGKPKLTVNPDSVPEGEMPSFFKDLGLNSPSDLDDQTMEETVVPAARLELARMRQQTLATMVLLGMSRVSVNEGEITAKLQFHIDASESMKLRFNQTKVQSGNITGMAGQNPFSANALLVNTANLNAQSDINVRADLTGQVKVNFKTDAFPLDRFADPLAIQMINQHAHVPAAPAPVAGAPPPTGALPAPAASGATPAAPASTPAVDPWAPR